MSKQKRASGTSKTLEQREAALKERLKKIEVQKQIRDLRATLKRGK